MSPNSNRPLSEIFENRSLFVLRLGQLALIAGFLIAGVILTYWIMNTAGNAIALLMVALGLVCLVISVVQPMQGMQILALACCYLDLIKRIAYYFGYYSAAGQGRDTLQLYILAFAPLTLVGLFLGVIIRRIFSTKRIIERREFMIVAFIAVSNLLVLRTYYAASHDLMEALSKSVNEGIYTLLLFILPAIFSTREEIARFLRYTFIIFLSCAVYGIWQGLTGYTALDIAWMQSGITITEGLLSDVKPRAFGTLASPHPYAVLYWLILLGVYFLSVAKGKRIFYLAAIAVYALGLFFSYGRGAWVSLLATFVALFCFQTRIRTISFYATVVSIFAVFVAFAKSIGDLLPEFQTYVPITSDTTDMAFRLGTFSDRLISIQNWTTSTRMWSWFGKPELTDSRNLGYSELTHEMFGQILVRYGAVGLFSVVIIGAFALFYFHRATLRIQDPKDRSLAIFLLAMISVNFFTSSLLGSNFQVFPWNFFIWLLVGFQIILCRQGGANTAPVEEPPHIPAGKWVRS